MINSYGHPHILVQTIHNSQPRKKQSKTIYQTNQVNQAKQKRKRGNQNQNHDIPLSQSRDLDLDQDIKKEKKRRGIETAPEIVNVSDQEVYPVVGVEAEVLAVNQIRIMRIKQSMSLV